MRRLALMPLLAAPFVSALAWSAPALAEDPRRAYIRMDVAGEYAGADKLAMVGRPAAAWPVADWLTGRVDHLMSTRPAYRLEVIVIEVLHREDTARLCGEPVAACAWVSTDADNPRAVLVSPIPHRLGDSREAEHLLGHELRHALDARMGQYHE